MYVDAYQIIMHHATQQFTQISQVVCAINEVSHNWHVQFLVAYTGRSTCL